MFPDELVFSDAGYINGSLIIELEHDFRCRTTSGTITVPSGFFSDGASIPRIFWNIFSPYGPYLKAAILHDYLYSQMSSAKYPAIDQEKADGLMLEAMKALGVGWLKRQTIHKALRCFGWTSYKKRWNALKHKRPLSWHES